MRLEDTKDKIYIYDLDSELAELESDEENPIFIPDIEKHLSKIPKEVLLDREPHSTANTQLVLYGVPSSLTVSPEHDSVRKIIMESRQRAREKQEHGDLSINHTIVPRTFATELTGFQNAIMAENEIDAMDMD